MNAWQSCIVIVLKFYILHLPRLTLETLCLVLNVFFSVLGYEFTQYTVTEEAGVVELCVISQTPVETQFTLISTTSPGSAGMIIFLSSAMVLIVCIALIFLKVV